MSISHKTLTDAKQLMPGVVWVPSTRRSHGPSNLEILSSTCWTVIELRGGAVTLEYRPDGTSFTGPDLQGALEAMTDHTTAKLEALHAAKRAPSKVQS